MKDIKFLENWLKECEDNIETHRVLIERYKDDIIIIEQAIKKLKS